MPSLNYLKKLLKTVIFYDHNDGDLKPSSLFSSDLSRTALILRVLKLIIAFPLSLIAWAMLRIVCFRYKVTIYVLKAFRPGAASTYLNMMEPLCRQLQYENNARHIKILIEPGEIVSYALVKSYEPHFTLYLDDRRKFTRLIAYLIPKSGLEKKFINTADKYLKSWLHAPSKNYAYVENQVPLDLAKMGIGKENYVIFVHASRNYYNKKFSTSELSDLQIRFYDLSTYRQAINRIIENNLKVVRVGTDVDELPDALKRLPIIDYTSETRNEASELWLYENCKFLLSATSGAYWFARRFDRPSILTNSYAWPFGFFSTLFTLMTFRSTETGNLLSFAETLKLRTTPDFLTKKFMSDHHLELLPNSSLTIANAVEDMFNFSNNKTVFTPENLELMNRYKDLLNKFNIPIAKNTTLPAISFLREYKHLL